MKKIFKFVPVFSLISLTPVIAVAQNTNSCGDGLTGVLCRINDLLGAVLPFLISLGVLYFIWGVVQYVIADSDEAKTKGKDKIIYGIIGLTVIVSLWGLVFLVVDTFGVGKNNLAPDVSNIIVTSTSSSECVIGGKLHGMIDYVTCIIGRSVIPFIFALAVVMFIWGAVKFFIINAEEDEKRAQGKQFMLWSIIALTVMISIWGLVSILGSTFGFNTGVLPQVKP